MWLFVDRIRWKGEAGVNAEQCKGDNACDDMLVKVKDPTGLGVGAEVLLTNGRQCRLGRDGSALKGRKGSKGRNDPESVERRH